MNAEALLEAESVALQMQEVPGTQYRWDVRRGNEELVQKNRLRNADLALVLRLQKNLVLHRPRKDVLRHLETS